METNNKNQNSVLLVMDVQEATLKMLNDNAGFTNSLTRAIRTARENRIRVIYIVVGFRKGYPEVSLNNKSFQRIRKETINFDLDEAIKVHPSFEPQPDDIIIIKKRVSAFAGSDLEVVLRSLEIKHLILTGIATSGVVLSTLREAADKDFIITVLTDCCADRDEEVHRILMTKVFPRQAEVITSDEWASAIRS